MPRHGSVPLNPTREASSSPQTRPARAANSNRCQARQSTGRSGHTGGEDNSHLLLQNQGSFKPTSSGPGPRPQQPMAALTLMRRLESLGGSCPPPVSMWYFMRKPMPRIPLTAMGICGEQQSSTGQSRSRKYSPSRPTHPDCLASSSHSDTTGPRTEDPSSGEGRAAPYPVCHSVAEDHVLNLTAVSACAEPAGGHVHSHRQRQAPAVPNHPVNARYVS